MGVILTTGLVLMLVMTAFEVYINRTLRPEKYHKEVYPLIMRLFVRPMFYLGPWIAKSPLNGIVFSLGLSVMVGRLFPATGVMIFMAGVGSTVIVQPYYMGDRFVRRYKANRANSIGMVSSYWRAMTVRD